MKSRSRSGGKLSRVTSLRSIVSSCNDPTFGTPSSSPHVPRTIKLRSSLSVLTAPATARTAMRTSNAVSVDRCRSFGCAPHCTGAGRLASQQVEEDLRTKPAHVDVTLALSPAVAETAPSADHLLGRAPTDSKLEASASDEVDRSRILDHVERVLVAHVDDRRANLDTAGLGAHGRASNRPRGVGHRSWRALRLTGP